MLFSLSVFWAFGTLGSEAVMRVPVYLLKRRCPLLISECVFTTSRRGQPLLQIGSHRYNIVSSNRKYGNDSQKLIWVCSKKFTATYCPVRIATWGNVVLKVMHKHNHKWTYIVNSNDMVSTNKHIFLLWQLMWYDSC